MQWSASGSGTRPLKGRRTKLVKTAAAGAVALGVFTVLFIFNPFSAGSSNSVNSAYAPDARVAVSLHLADHSLWPEFLPCIMNVAEEVHQLQLYITLVKGYKHSDMELKAMTQRIRAHFPGAVVLQVSNFGMDIAGFLAVVKEMLHLQAAHKVLLKLHSKTKKYWRDKMLEGVCATPNLVHKILDKFSQDETAAMLGSRDYCWYMDLNDRDLISEHYAPRFKLNTSFYDTWDSQRLADLPYDVSEYLNNRQNVDLKAAFANAPEAAKGHWQTSGLAEHRPHNKKIHEVYRHLNYPKFIAGSVFWINLGPLLTFFREHGVTAEIDSLRNELGFVTDVVKDTDGGLQKSSKYTHCWERLWILVFRSQNMLFKTVCGA